MPESMSSERVTLLQHLGAEVILTPGILMAAAVARAHELARKIPDSIVLDQFRNPANPEIHRRTTAVELCRDAGRIDAFVCAVGTGGTITGVGEVLNARNSGTQVIAVEPKGAAVLSGGKAGNHSIPGIGCGLHP
jgi:cysteine synthase A